MTAMNPLPSLIQAASHDAGCNSMRAAGRTKWSRADYHASAATANRLIEACYRLPADDSPHVYKMRFGIAQQLERDGYIDLWSDWKAVMALIEEIIAAPVDAVA